MSRKKKAAHPRDERALVGEAQRIRERLNEFVEIRFEGNWAQFARELGVPLASAEEWKLAKTLWPSFDNLLKLAEHRLSIDWLITGRGHMLFEGVDLQTDAGRLLQILRPYAQRFADVSEFVEEQAFNRLIATRGLDAALRLAATGLVPWYEEVKRELKVLDEISRMSAWFVGNLDLLEANLIAGDGDGFQVALAETRRHISELVPKWTQTDDFMDAWTRRIERSLRQQLEAQQRGLHTEAFMTAADVASQLDGAKAALESVRQQVGLPNPEVLKRLASIATVLSQLQAPVRSLLTPMGEDAAARSDASPNPNSRKQNDT